MIRSIVISVIFHMCLVPLCYSQEPIVPQISFENSTLLKVLDRYAKHLRNGNFDFKLKRQIILRIDTLKEGNIVYYLWCTPYIGYFRDDIPHAYFERKGKTVFIFKSRESINFEQDRFNKFYYQFKGALEKDILPDGSPIDTGIIIDEQCQCWQVVDNGRGQLTVNRVTHEPTSSFFNEHDFNNEGHLIYKDRIFDNSAAFPNFARPPDNFNVRDFVLNNSKVPKDSLSKGTQRNVDALLVVDENGRVSEVKVKGIEDLSTKQQIENVLMTMPLWKPAIINGKRTKVRTILRL